MLLLLRAARAASLVAGGGASRKPCLPIGIAALSSSSAPSGGRRKKGQRRGEAKPQPQPLQHTEIPGKKKPNARPAKGKKDHPVEEAQGPPGKASEARKKKQQPPPPPPVKAKRVVKWKCASGCGACCKLDKGPEFPSPEEVFADHPEHLQLYKGMIGPDGWCNNYDKSTRTCNIYQDRPFFCRVEPKVFDDFFGVPRSSFDREACSACVDNIKMVYGQDSAEYGNFKRVIREESGKHEASKNQDKLLDT